MYQISREPVPITLSGLPLELQIQILSLLEWDEVLHTRQVSLTAKMTFVLGPITRFYLLDL